MPHYRPFTIWAWDKKNNLELLQFILNPGKVGKSNSFRVATRYRRVQFILHVYLTVLLRQTFDYFDSIHTSRSA